MAIETLFTINNSMARSNNVVAPIKSFSRAILPEQISSVLTSAITQNLVVEKNAEAEEFQIKIQDPQPVEIVVNRVNDLIQNIRRELRFTLEEESGKTIIKVIDAESGDIIRQLPSEQLLDLARNLEQAGGILLKEKA